MTFGIDYAFSPHPPVAAMKTAGVKFVCRYISQLAINDRNGKNLVPAELKTLLGAGIAVVLVVEEGAQRMQAGHATGVADAAHADAVAKALGLKGVPIYFAADWDATPADQAAINLYLDGAASVISRGRTGIYGGYYPVKRALDAAKAAWAWQTTAWSGGLWDPRAQLRQGLTVSVGGFGVDVDHAMKPDFGQWPRPAPPPPPPVGAGTGPYRHLTDGRTLAQVAAARHTTVDHLWSMIVAHYTAADIALFGDAPTKDVPFYTSNP